MEREGEFTIMDHGVGDRASDLMHLSEELLLAGI